MTIQEMTTDQIRAARESAKSTMNEAYQQYEKARAEFKMYSAELTRRELNPSNPNNPWRIGG